MPGDSLAFAVRVRCQIEGIGAFQSLGNGLDVTVVLFDDLIFHLEIVGRIDSALFGHQVAHVTIGGQHFEVLAEIFLNGFGFCRRFYNYQIHRVSLDILLFF